MTQDCQRERWSAFGWNVLEADGHDIQTLDTAISKAKEQKNKTTVIIANTIKGYGYTEAENNLAWHHKVPDKKQYRAASDEITQREADMRREALRV
jgi:transketolase